MVIWVTYSPARAAEAWNKPIFSDFREILHAYSDTLMDDEQDTALLKAVLREDSQAVSQQLHGDLNDRPEIVIGWSLLHVAVINRSPEMAAALLRAGADPGHRDVIIGTPIRYMALTGDPELFQTITGVLLDQGRLPEFVDDIASVAAEMGHRWMLEAIKGTVSPNYDFGAYRDDFGRSLLHLASGNHRENRYDTILYLLKAGLDPWQPDNEGITPWQVVDRENDEAAKALMLSPDPKTFQRLSLLGWRGPLWSLLWTLKAAIRLCQSPWCLRV